MTMTIRRESGYWRRLGIALCALSILSLPLFAASRGDPFEIRRSTIDGGGGVSSGGDFRLSGSIAQPDAGQSRGGIYRLQGGFWSGPPPADALFSDGFETP